MLGLAANELIVIGMLVSFIGLLFMGVPVAWSLAGVSVLATVIAIPLNNNYGVDTYFLDSWKDYSVIT